LLSISLRLSPQWSSCDPQIWLRGINQEGKINQKLNKAMVAESKASDANAVMILDVIHGIIFFIRTMQANHIALFVCQRIE
jgi:hypothetical protein